MTTTRTAITNVILEEEDEEEENEDYYSSKKDEEENSVLINNSIYAAVPARTTRNIPLTNTIRNRSFVSNERRDSGAIFSIPKNALFQTDRRSISSDSTESSDESNHDFPVSRIEDNTMSQMLAIGALNENQSRFGKSTKYLNRISMTEYVAVTMTLPSSEDVEKEVIGELQGLVNLRHERIARFYGYYVSSDMQITMFRAFMPSGTVADKLKVGPLSESLALRYFEQSLNALAYLHDECIIHGNLKGSNLLVTLSNDILLADPAITGAPEPDAHLRRSLLHAAPEMLQDKYSLHKTTDTTDIWALGCVMVSMLTRYPPFQDHYISYNSVDKLHEKLVQVNTEGPHPSYTPEALLPTCSSQLAEIIKSVFIKQSSRRPTASQLLDKFFTCDKRPSSDSIRIRRPTTMTHDDLYNDVKINVTSDLYRDSVSNIEDNEGEEENDGGQVMKESSQNLSAVMEWTKFYSSRLAYFIRFALRTVGMFFLAAFSLALVAGTVFSLIVLIYKGIGVVCGCNLNEGFIVLIALIMLPVLILLTSLCCNNTLEKFKHSPRSLPDEEVVLCGIVVIDGKRHHKTSVKRKLATTNEELTSPEHRTAFSHGVSRIA